MNAALAVGALAVGIMMLEIASRVLLPISPGTRFVDAGGNEVPLGVARPLPNTEFRQVSADYDVVGHTGPLGNRIPSVDNPDVVFVGDSFTFGQGLSDGETFAAIFCDALSLRCANLGRPGTGTYRQVRVLEDYLRVDGWRPREVKLFVLAMSSSLMSGNDFDDTVQEITKATASSDTTTTAGAASAATNPWEWIVQRRQWILAHSNLARVGYAQFGPAVRALAPRVAGSQLATGIAAVAEQLQVLADLSSEFGFRYTIYVLHPIQDLLRGTYGDTERAVRFAAGGAPVHDTARALLANPRASYYAYDGHFNPAGARRVAEFLLSEGGDP